MRALRLQSRELGKASPYRWRRTLWGCNGIDKRHFTDFEVGAEDEFRVTYPIQSDHIGHPTCTAGVEAHELGRRRSDETDFLLQLTQNRLVGRLVADAATTGQQPA